MDLLEPQPVFKNFTLPAMEILAQTAKNLLAYAFFLAKLIVAAVGTCVTSCPSMACGIELCLLSSSSVPFDYIPCRGITWAHVGGKRLVVSKLLEQHLFVLKPQHLHPPTPTPGETQVD